MKIFDFAMNMDRQFKIKPKIFIQRNLSIFNKQIILSIHFEIFRSKIRPLTVINSFESSLIYIKRSFGHSNKTI